MPVRTRMVASCTCLVLAGALLGAVAPSAAEPIGPSPLMGAAEAMAQARLTGESVVASALTDEHTLVTADPESGLMTAHLSAGIARVEDGSGGWREPSATLARGGDGLWRPEAAAVDLAVSGGGDGAVATLADGSAQVGFDWPTDLPAPSVEGEVATYSDVAPGVDLVVRAAVDGVETFVVVKTAEAAQDPLVQSVPVTATAEGLEATTQDNGDITFADAAGEDRFVLPKAYAWDSAGQPADAGTSELIEPAEGSAVVPLDAEVATTGADTTATLSPATEMLQDPDTVFPVVIDPSLSLDETHALRVTQTFHKYDSDIGSTAKLGYNGWTSPYYKSRMFYQFKWPLNDDDSIVRPAQIAGATFKYKQTYSPQSSCSDNDFGPAVRVQPSTVISGDVSWSDQPSLHSGSLYSSNDYAVGQNCGSYLQKWNVTSMLQKERTDYSTRTTVTLRISSADETDRNGWREYANTSSSPDLVLDYEPEPPAPTSFSIVDAVETDPTIVTNQADPALKVKVSLAGSYECRTTTACMKAELTLLKHGEGTSLDVVQAAGLSTQSVPASGDVRIPVTGLSDGDYIARVRGYNLDTGLYSTTHTDFAFQVDLAPGKPQWSWVIPEGWEGAPALPYGRVLQIAVSPNQADSDVVGYCVEIITDGDPARTCSPAPQDGLLSVGPFPAGSAQVSIAAQDSHSTGDFQLDSPEPARTFSW